MIDPRKTSSQAIQSKSRHRMIVGFRSNPFDTLKEATLEADVKENKTSTDPFT